MTYIFITLGSVSILFWILSFFMKDRYKQIEEEVEQISISTIQEIYLLKKRMKILEEELLTEGVNVSSMHSIFSPGEIQRSLIEKIRIMHGKGMNSALISRETSISEEDINLILQKQAIISESSSL